MTKIMVFDWVKAAKIIKNRKPSFAYAGLQNDYEDSGAVIYDKGQMVHDGNPFLASVWRKPMLLINNEEPIECWRYKQDENDWNARTIWPDEAKMELIA